MSTSLHNFFSATPGARLSRRLAILLFVAGMGACTSVKPYQRAYLNDEAMQTGKREPGKLSSNVHNYREGASGGGTAKSSGGCGCN